RRRLPSPGTRQCRERRRERPRNQDRRCREFTLARNREASPAASLLWMTRREAAACYLPPPDRAHGSCIAPSCGSCSRAPESSSALTASPQLPLGSGWMLTLEI